MKRLTLTPYVGSTEFCMDYGTMFLGLMYLLTVNGNNQMTYCDVIYSQEVQRPSTRTAARASTSWSVFMGFFWIGTFALIIYKSIKNISRKMNMMIYLALFTCLFFLGILHSVLMACGSGDSYGPKFWHDVPCQQWTDRAPYTFGMAFMYLFSFRKYFFAAA